MFRLKFPTVLDSHHPIILCLKWPHLFPIFRTINLRSQKECSDEAGHVTIIWRGVVLLGRQRVENRHICYLPFCSALLSLTSNSRTMCPSKSYSSRAKLERTVLKHSFKANSDKTGINCFSLSNLFQIQNIELLSLTSRSIL